MKSAHPIPTTPEPGLQNQVPLSTEKFPPLDDQAWRRWADPLLAFLSHPREWSALATWSKGRRISGDKLRNMLAWVSINSLADVRYEEASQSTRQEADQSGQVLFWFRVE